VGEALGSVTERAPPRRVVLDTNVVASALLFPGPTMAQLRRAWMDGSIVPLVCRETTLELVRVLAYPKFELSEDEHAQLLADYLPWCEVVTVDLESPRGPRCRDPQDQVFVELAIEGRAECIVSGDRALLELDGVKRLKVLKPAELFSG
jgi:uncharacterized protein